MNKISLNERIESIFEQTCIRLGYNGFNTSKNTVVKSTSYSDMASRIEHTLLKINASQNNVSVLCQQAIDFGFRSVCVLPRDIEICRKFLDMFNPIIVTVVNFPLSGSCQKDVIAQTKNAINAGADEIDMVIDVRSLCEDELENVRDNIANIVLAANDHPVKVILETGCLDESQIIKGCAVSEVAGASFVKTCTGFGPRGATIDDILIMKTSVKNRLGIKASGGIKSAEFANQIIEAGADLIGTSSGSEITS